MGIPARTQVQMHAPFEVLNVIASTGSLPKRPPRITHSWMFFQKNNVFGMESGTFIILTL